MFKKLICFLLGHKDVYIFRARYVVSNNCLRCNKILYKNSNEYRKREKEVLEEKYGIFWREYL